MNIVVIGSINMDLVCRVDALPTAGQTVLGKEFLTIPGGKGANQAVAAARLARGARVHMIGRVGDDQFGARLKKGLRENGVNVDHVAITPGASGLAMILIDRRGENSIVVAPGANHRLTPRDIDSAEKLIASADIVLLQLEIPLKTAAHAIRVARRHSVLTILDPAPAPEKFPRTLLDVDILTPNETEARNITRCRGAMVTKLGSRGAMIVDGDGRKRIAPFKAKVVDTTAAGDAFTAALGVAIAEGKSLADAVRFANAAGAACCEKLGAQPSLPTRSQVERML